MSLGYTAPVNDLDIESVEILPGASSALYGANAYNGLMIMKTKNPFDYSGLSAEFRSGIMNQSTGNQYFNDIGTRYACVFDKRFAAKVNLSISTGKEWKINDYRNIINGAVSNNDKKNSPLQNGVNTYGDNTLSSKQLAYTNFLITPSAQTAASVAEVKNIFVDRTGYNEVDLTDHESKNVKFTSALHYRPFSNEKLEIIFRHLNSFITSGFQGAPSRYKAGNAKITVNSLEFKGTSFFLRAYKSSGRLDNASNHVLLGNILTQASDPNHVWLTKYVKNYQATNSHVEAREFADNNRLVPGTSVFNSFVNERKLLAVNNNGSKIIDKSGFYHTDGNYNFGTISNFIDIQSGFSYRRFVIDSDGVLFTDYDDQICFDEYGAYVQGQAKMLDDRLKLVSSFRYDKSNNLKGNLSPRLAVLYSLGSNRNHNLRLTYQTAFRNPTVHNQYLGLQIGSNSFRVGNVTENIKRFKGVYNDRVLGPIPVESLLDKSGFTVSSFTKVKNGIFNNLKDNDGVNELFDNTKKNITLMESSKFDKRVNAEGLKSFEVGYRGIFDINNKLFEIDVTGFYNRYTDFISDKTILIPTSKGADVNAPISITPKSPYEIAISSILTGRFIALTMPVNSIVPITSYGLTGSVHNKLYNKFDCTLSYSWLDYTYDKKKELGFKPGFNTPNHTIKFMIGNKKIIGNLGFNIAYRYHTEYLWESTFATGTIDSQHIIDTQLTYSLPSLKSRIKLGANNIFGKAYYSGLGSGQIGSTYFLSWTINN